MQTKTLMTMKPRICFSVLYLRSEEKERREGQGEREEGSSRAAREEGEHNAFDKKKGRHCE